MKLKSFKKNILESVKLYNKQEPVSTVDKDLVPTVDNIEYQNAKVSDKKAKEREDELEPNIKAADELAKEEGSLNESSDNKVPITSLNKGDKFIYNSNVCQVTATDNKRNIEAKFPDGKIRSISAVSRVTKANPDAELKRLDVVRELDPIKEGVNKTVKFRINDKKLKEFNDYISKIGFKVKETGRKDDTTDVFASYTEVEVSGDAFSSAWDKLEKDVKSHFASPVSNSKLEDYINQDDLKKAVKNAFGYEGQDAQNTINKMDDKTKQDLVKKDKEKNTSTTTTQQSGNLNESLEDDIKKEVAITSEWLKTWDNKYDGLYCKIENNKVHYTSAEGLEVFTFDEFDKFFKNQIVDNIWTEDLSKENLDTLHSLGLKTRDEKEVEDGEKLTETSDRFSIETDDELDRDSKIEDYKKDAFVTYNFNGKVRHGTFQQDYGDGFVEIFDLDSARRVVVNKNKIISVKDLTIEEEKEKGVSEKMDSKISNCKKESCNKKPHVLKEAKQIDSDIGSYFNYSGDFDFLEIVQDVVDRVTEDIKDGSDIDDVIFDEIDSVLIYYSDQWTIMEHYQNPSEADLDAAIEELYDDVYAICSKRPVESEDEDEEENESLKEGHDEKCDCPECKAEKRLVKKEECEQQECKEEKDCKKEKQLDKKLERKVEKPLKEASETSVDEVANFIKDSVESLKDGSSTNNRLKLDDRLAVFVGWSDGYDEDDETVIHNEDEPSYAINAGIKVWTSDDMWTDFDFLNFAYHKDGDIEDISLSIGPDDAKDGYKSVAKWLLDEYESIKDLNISEDGLIIEESLKEKKDETCSKKEECKDKKEIKESIDTKKEVKKPIIKRRINESLKDDLDVEPIWDDIICK